MAEEAQEKTSEEWEVVNINSGDAASGSIWLPYQESRIVIKQSAALQLRIFCNK